MEIDIYRSCIIIKESVCVFEGFWGGVRGGGRGCGFGCSGGFMMMMMSF